MPGNHMTEGENQLPKVVLWPPNERHRTAIYTSNRWALRTAANKSPLPCPTVVSCLVSLSLNSPLHQSCLAKCSCVHTRSPFHTEIERPTIPFCIWFQFWLSHTFKVTRYGPRTCVLQMRRVCYFTKERGKDHRSELTFPQNYHTNFSLYFPGFCGWEAVFCLPWPAVTSSLSQTVLPCFLLVPCASLS